MPTEIVENTRKTSLVEHRARRLTILYRMGMSKQFGNIEGIAPVKLMSICRPHPDRLTLSSGRCLRMGICGFRYG